MSRLLWISSASAGTSIPETLTCLVAGLLIGSALYLLRSYLWIPAWNRSVGPFPAIVGVATGAAFLGTVSMVTLVWTLQHADRNLHLAFQQAKSTALNSSGQRFQDVSWRRKWLFDVAESLQRQGLETFADHELPANGGTRIRLSSPRSLDLARQTCIDAFDRELKDSRLGFAPAFWCAYWKPLSWPPFKPSVAVPWAESKELWITADIPAQPVFREAIEERCLQLPIELKASIGMEPVSVRPAVLVWGATEFLAAAVTALAASRQINLHF